MENESRGNTIGYISFVIVSAIVGFFGIYSSCKFLLKFSPIISIILGIVALIIYLVLCFSLRKFLENIFLSEFFLYLFFGFLTTIINYIAFYLLDNGLSKSTNLFSKEKIIVVSQIIAFIVAVIFAYITNKIFVFKSMNISLKVLFKEMGEFFLARIFTFVLETIGILCIVKYTNFKDMFAKLVVSIVCIVLNYIFSKLFIFKKSND